MTSPAEEDAVVATGSRSRNRRLVGSIVGLLLLVAAIVAVLTNRTSLAAAFDAIERAPIWLVVLALLLPLANWVLISVSFWVLTRRYGRVGLGEMHALIASAWLLNYLPLRPGMFGRLAYHKRVNGIGVADSVRVLVTSVSLTLISNAIICAVAWVAYRAGPAAGWLIVAVPGVLIGLAGLVLARREQSAFAFRPGLAIALCVRYFDILAWVARYAVVFALIGHPLSLAQATLITAVSQAALLIPFVGNGLGVREWGIGLALPVLSADSPRALGLTADLVNRAAELLVAVPVGLGGSAWLYHRTRHSGPAGRGRLQSPDDPADAQSRTGS
ncbi:MAG: flippase-like domain-containing protein [Phycisphaerales bacterium]|nr:flippase-like domain-containing protein [Phycisphaerales bacterium]